MKEQVKLQYQRVDYYGFLENVKEILSVPVSGRDVKIGDQLGKLQHVIRQG